MQIYVRKVRRGDGSAAVQVHLGFYVFGQLNLFCNFLSVHNQKRFQIQQPIWN